MRQHEFIEQLIDPNNKQLTVKLRFRISYLPPDSHLADVAAVDLPGDTVDALGSDRDKSMSTHPWQLEQFHTVNYGIPYANMKYRTIVNVRAINVLRK